MLLSSWQGEGTSHMRVLMPIAGEKGGGECQSNFPVSTIFWNSFILKNSVCHDAILWGSCLEPISYYYLNVHSIDFGFPSFIPEHEAPVGNFFFVSWVMFPSRLDLSTHPFLTYFFLSFVYSHFWWCDSTVVVIGIPGENWDAMERLETLHFFLLWIHLLEDTTHISHNTWYLLLR